MITIITLSVLLTISCLVNINQLRKQEGQQDYIDDLEKSNLEYYTFHEMLKNKLTEANSEIRNADRLGAFESSDEIGHAFNLIKDVIEDLHKGIK